MQRLLGFFHVVAFHVGKCAYEVEDYGGCLRQAAPSFWLGYYRFGFAMFILE
jgi:hypothetical protein